MFKKSLKLKWLCAAAIPLIGMGVWLFFQLDFLKKSNELCPFCRSELLDVQAFYRKDGAIGLLTHKPAVPGHLLIIPERHVERFEELTPEEIQAIGDMIKRVDQAVRQLYHTTGYDLLQKNGKEAGQTVPHVHFHYLPRSQETGEARFLIRFFLMPWLKPLTNEEMRGSPLHEFFDSARFD